MPLPINSTPYRKPWEEKNPWVAGILAYLIPGAGHFYQGRVLKGFIYSVSILGLFFWGQKLGQGMVVNNMSRSGNSSSRMVALSYAAQLGVGASALPAFVQNARAESPANAPVTRLTSRLATDFQGSLIPFGNSDEGQLIGTILLEPAEGQFGPEVRGSFEGTLNGTPTKLSLGGRFRMDRPIKAGYRRFMECDVQEDDDTANHVHRHVEGTIPRSVVDAYGSPPDPDQIQELYEELGTVFDLALVFTWIAGLLNVLAIWDCVCGPAYGFGDEHARDSSNSNSAGAGSPEPPATAANSSSSSEPPRTENRPVEKTPV